MKFGSLIILLNFLTTYAECVEISFNELKDLVENKNTRVHASQLLIDSSVEREGHLVRSFLPKLSLSAGNETFKTGPYGLKTQPVYGIEGSINLYNGGKDQIESEIRELSTVRNKNFKKLVITEEVRVARELYWEAVFLEEKRIFLNESIETNKKNAASAEKRIKSGVATQTDRIEFEMEHINLSRELLGTNTKLANTLNSLKVILSLPENTELKLIDKFVHDHDFEKMLSLAQSEYEFTFKGTEINAKINSLMSKKEKNDIYPKLEAYANYFQYNQKEKDYPSKEDRDEYVIGLRVSIDFPSGFESRRNAAALFLEAKAEENNLEYQKRDIKNHLDNEINQLKFLHEQVHHAEENIVKAQKYYQLTQSEYARGVKNSPDVLSATQLLFAAKEKHLEIIKEFQISKSHILSQIGK